MDKKLTILQVHNFYQLPGGEDTVLENEGRLMEGHGHRVLRYCRDNKELKDFSFFRKLLLPLTTVFNPKTYRDVRRVIREEHVDVVHVHNTLNLISPSVYYAALAEGVPVVQTVHNFRLLCPGATFYREGRICEDCLSRGLGCAVRHACYRGSKIQTLACVLSTKFHRMTGIYGKLHYICLTDFNREKLLNLKQIRPERVFVKPNFVDSGEHTVIPEAQRKDRFLFAGRLDRLKGLEMLLAGWKLLGQEAPELLICGTGPMEDWCRAYIAENALTSVRMLGFVENQRVKGLMAESKALLLPTQWYEGFPMTIVEAFSVGTPVLCSDLGNAGSIVTEGVTGRKFPPDSPEALAQAVSSSGGMCESTYEQYMCSYTSERNYEILMNVYAQALGGRNERRETE
ncbi:MAG: glycosyltransferase family 4 protein [Eubacteriales bacterium]|nr:glycosyltransferase family 4 protein [Eubacteriales bacterium]